MQCDVLSDNRLRCRRLEDRFVWSKPVTVREFRLLNKEYNVVSIGRTDPVVLIGGIRNPSVRVKSLKKVFAQDPVDHEVDYHCGVLVRANNISFGLSGRYPSVFVIAHVSRTVQTKRNIVIARPVTPARSRRTRVNYAKRVCSRHGLAWLANVGPNDVWKKVIFPSETPTGRPVFRVFNGAKVRFVWSVDPLQLGYNETAPRNDQNGFYPAAPVSFVSKGPERRLQ